MDDHDKRLQYSATVTRGELTVFQDKALTEEPIPGPARPDSGAQDPEIV